MNNTPKDWILWFYDDVLFTSLELDLSGEEHVSDAIERTYEGLLAPIESDLGVSFDREKLKALVWYRRDPTRLLYGAMIGLKWFWRVENIIDGKGDEI